MCLFVATLVFRFSQYLTSLSTKTDAGRLHTDMFTFLSESSAAFQKHFSKELRSVIERSKMSMSVTTVAPAAVVFHETRRTDLLDDKSADTREVRHYHLTT